MFRAIQFVLVVVVLFGTCAVAQANFIVEGQSYTDVFHDDFSGTGTSRASDNPTYAWNTGDGLDSAKWEWRVGNSLTTVYIQRDGGGTAQLYSAASESHYSQAYTEPGALDGMVGATSWAYEVVFELQTGGDLRDDDRTINLLWGRSNVTEVDYVDVYFAFGDGDTGDTFDIDWCVTREDGDETAIFEELTRGTQYTLQARHNADHTIDTFLFETDTPSNNWSDLGRAALTTTPAALIEVGDASSRISADFVLASMRAGVVPEPSTLALLVTGLIGLLCYAWRKRK